MNFLTIWGHAGLRRMVDEVVREELLEDLEIAFALHLFGIVADDSLGGFAGCAVPHCLSNRPVIRIDLLLVHDDDIPGFVEEVCDLGIVGENVLHEQRPSGRCIPTPYSPSATPAASSSWRQKSRIGFLAPNSFELRSSPVREVS